MVLHVNNGAVVGVADISIKEKYLIVVSGGTTYSGELGRSFNPPISIHIPIWFLVEYPVQWDVEVEILGVLLYLVKINGQNEAFPIGSGKNK